MTDQLKAQVQARLSRLLELDGTTDRSIVLEGHADVLAKNTECVRRIENQLAALPPEQRAAAAPVAQLALDVLKKIRAQVSNGKPSAGAA